MPQKFPAVEDALNEAREMFSYQQHRFQSIESKATALLSLNALVFAILAVVPLQNRWLYLPVFLALAAAIIFTFRVFWLRNGSMPHSDFEEYYEYAKLPRKQAQDKFLLNYTQVLKTEHQINEDKVRALKWVIIASAIAWLFFVLIIIGQFILAYCSIL